MGKVFNISVDPGTSATGICVWENGRVHLLDTLRPDDAKACYIDKIISIGRQFRELCMTLIDVENSIVCVAIENFEKHHNKHDEAAGAANAKMAMIKCAGVKGILIGVADCFADEVIEASKGTTTKEETRLRAKAYGIKVDGKGKERVSKDALDAFEIGVCCGMDSRSW